MMIGWLPVDWDVPSGIESSPTNQLSECSSHTAEPQLNSCTGPIPFALSAASIEFGHLSFLLFHASHGRLILAG